jgi:hypothetical protein
MVVAVVSSVSSGGGGGGDGDGGGGKVGGLSGGSCSGSGKGKGSGGGDGVSGGGGGGGGCRRPCPVLSPFCPKMSTIELIISFEKEIVLTKIIVIDHIMQPLPP